MDEFFRDQWPRIQVIGLDVGTKILGALVLWIVGRFIIGLLKRIVSASMTRQRVEPTLIRYLASTLGILLNIVLFIAVLGVFGVETATFAGLLAAAGIAIGMAWSGLLSNFAAGVFMIVLRPFKVGDFVSAGGTVGTVEEIGLFVTTINTPDNVRTFVGNSKVFGDTIQNFSANPSRRVELLCQLAHGVDAQDAMRLLRARVLRIPNVATSPPPEVDILEFTLAGPVIAVRPYTHTDHYWQVYFDTNAAIAEVGGAAGYPAPHQHLIVTNLATK